MSKIEFTSQKFLDLNIFHQKQYFKKFIEVELHKILAKWTLDFHNITGNIVIRLMGSRKEEYQFIPGTA